MEIKVDAKRLKFGEQLNQMLKTSAKTVDRPCGDHVEFAFGGCFHESVETGALVAALGAAELVLERCDDLPSGGLGDRRKLAELVLSRLVAVVGRDAQIQGYALFG